MDETPSNVVDFYSDTANVNGCQPCPQCFDEERYPDLDLQIILCDHCGFYESFEGLD